MYRLEIHQIVLKVEDCQGPFLPKLGLLPRGKDIYGESRGGVGLL